LFLFQLFRSFLPLHNPIGFGAADFIELAVVILFALLVAAWPRLRGAAARLAPRTAWSMLLLAAAPVALRLLLLPQHPAPQPRIYDEFGHLLVADTLRHFRLANPPHALPQFFETFFVLQQPTYSSIYPIGQGLALAVGWTLFGTPWAGVLLCVGASCALCYWMLRAWTTPGWALAGGLLAIAEFGPLSEWTNSYWGGAFAAAAGCLVFGALPRLRAEWRMRDAVLLGLGLGIHLLIRPYESVFLLAAVIAWFAPVLRRPKEQRLLARLVPVTVMAVLPAIALTLVQNREVTGSWTTLPYQLSQYQYGVPAALTFQSNPTPHRALTPQQALDYEMQRDFRASGPETLKTYLLRLEYRVRFYRFFFLVPIYLALPFFLLRLGEWRFAWVAATLMLFALGVNFFPAFQVHYLAGVTCLFVLVAVAGLERMARWNAEVARLLLLLCAVQFLFWYGLHLAEAADFRSGLQDHETWASIPHGQPDARALVREQIARNPGKLLVFVHYGPEHMFQQEWVWNAADIDAARVVWARDLGPLENQKLLRYYPGRTPLLLDPDHLPPVLEPYREQPPPPPAVEPTKPAKPQQSGNPFLPVPEAKQ
jgi:hypothetical protein